MQFTRPTNQIQWAVLNKDTRKKNPQNSDSA